MIGLLKKYSPWFLPPKIESNLKYILRTIRQLKYQASNSYNLDKNKLLKFKDIHEGRRCFVLATGPSINSQNLKPLSKEICFSVSQFMLHPDIKIINPRYNIEAPNHAPFDFDDLRVMFDGYNKNLSKETILFCGHTPYKYSILDFLKRHPEYNNERIHHINYSMSTYIDEFNYQDSNIWDISVSPFLIRTVIYMAIQIALYMGFKQIFLLGCDHDYLNDLKRVKNHHFYNDEESGISDAEHLSSFDTEWWFQQYYFRWKEYKLMKQYAEKRGCKIFNATAGGMLDVFPRIKLEDVLSK